MSGVNMYNNKLTKAIRLAMIIGAGSATAISVPTFAAEDEASVERIEVTGSRIKRTDMEGAAPVTVITSVDILKMGVTNVGDMLQNLTSSAGAAINTAVNNGGDGSIQFSLRGLGSQRTLVLVNGRRMVKGGNGPGSGNTAAVDLGTIPLATIKRVEVLKDGASALYGSDGIAGVVNIITKNDYEGAELKASYGITSEDDGRQDSVDFTIGAASDKGNIVFAAGWSRQGEIMMGDRKQSEFELRLYEDGHTEQGGSSAPPWSNVDGYPGSAATADSPLADANVTRGPEYGDWRTRDGSIDSYNYNPVNFHQTPNEKWHLTAMGGYDVGSIGILEDVRMYGEASYVKHSSDVLFAPEPLAPLVFFGTAAPYSPDNYYNQQFGPKDPNGNAYELQDWRRRMLETGGRASSSSRGTSRIVLGFEGTFSNGWDWDVYYMRGDHTSSTYQQGYFNLARVGDAVGPTHFDANGDLQCGTSDSPIGNGCVPLNIFGEPGTDTEVSAEMLQYISGNYNTTNTGDNYTESWAASVSGEVFELPAGFAGFAFGVESREEGGSYIPDSLLLGGTTTAGSSLATEGSYTVDEAFLEFIIPLVSDVAFAESIELSTAVRYSDYSTFGDNTSGKLGFVWKVNDQFTARATISDAFRAPDTSELFGGANTAFPSASDPCANISSPNQYCTGTGVPSAGFDDGSIEQIPTRQGGSEGLTPEEADITTVGVVYSPDWADGLSLTLDYWKIDLTNYISTIGTQIILDSCMADGTFCDKVQRIQSGANQGTIILVNDLNTNVGGVDTSGVDANIKYVFDSSVGEFRVNFDTSYLIEYNKHNANGDVKHHGWLRDAQDGNFPRLKVNLSMDWSYENFSQNVAIKYIHKVKEIEQGWWTAPFEHQVDSFTTIDWQGNYLLEEYNTNFTLGIINLLDEEPPYAYSAFNGNTDGRTYDVKGRQYYLSATVSF
jgi:outer membrane receptor protein involved in Fe transport